MSTNQKTALNKHQRNKERRAWGKVFYILGHIIGVPGIIILLIGFSVGNPNAMLLGLLPLALGFAMSLAALEDEEPKNNEIEQKKLQDKAQSKKEELLQQPNPTKELTLKSEDASSRKELKLQAEGEGSKNELKAQHEKAVSNEDSDLEELDLEEPDTVAQFIQKASALNEDEKGLSQYRSILQAFQNKDPKILELCSPKNNCSILHYEVMYGRAKFVEILLSFGAKADIKSTGPIRGVISLGGDDPLDLTKAMFPAHITPLMVAARYLYPEIVQNLISSKPEPNLKLRDKNGFTVLCHALYGIPLYGKDKNSQTSKRILIVDCLLQAGAPIENISQDSEYHEDRHAFFNFVGSFSQTFLIPSFLKYTNITLESRNINNDTLFMHCVKFCIYKTIKELIKLQVNVDTINEIDPKRIFLFLSMCVRGNENELAKFIISRIRIKKTLLDLFHYANHLDKKVKILLQTSVSGSNLLLNYSAEKKRASEVFKGPQKKFRSSKKKSYNIKQKVLSEAEKLSSMVTEKATFYPSKIENAQGILLKDKKMILELQRALIENERINQISCESAINEKSRLERLQENQAERKKVDELLQSIYEIESKLQIFQNRLNGLQTAIQAAAQSYQASFEQAEDPAIEDRKQRMEKYKLKRMNLENGFIKHLFPLWEDPKTGIGTLLEVFKKKKFALSSAQEWEAYTRIDNKYKRQQKIALSEGTSSATSVKAMSKANNETSSEVFQAIKSGRAQKREKHFAKKAERTERLKRFDHMLRKQKEEEAEFFASFVKPSTPPRKSPSLQPQTLTIQVQQALTQPEAVLTQLETIRSESESVSTQREFRSAIPKDFTLEMATQAYKRTETLEEVDSIEKALQYNCPKNCDATRYKKYDSYDILLVCAQAMHTLDQKNQSIFPKNMANQFRNAIYKGKFLSEEDLIKRNSEIREMAKKLKDFISGRCRKLSDSDLNQPEIEKAINVDIFSEILSYSVPQLYLKDATQKYKDLCKEVMDKCLHELDDMLQFKTYLTKEKWASAFFLIKARLGAHFNYYKRNCKGDSRYQYYLEICGKYRRIANQIRHNQKRPFGKAQTGVANSNSSQMKDLATDVMLSLNSSDQNTSVDMNNILELTESLGINQADLDAVTKTLSAQADFTDYQAAFPPTMLTMRSSSFSATQGQNGTTSSAVAESVDTDEGDMNTSKPVSDKTEADSVGTVLFTQGMRRGCYKGRVRV